MTVQTARIVAAPKAYAFKGANKTVRDAALAGVAGLAYQEGASRADTVARLRLALGAKPTDADIAAIRVEYLSGRVAQRLAGTDLPKADMSVADRITFARSVILQYAAPAKDGVKSKLRAGQAGRRTITQHKACRAADEAWSQMKAELGMGTAKTQDTKNAAKRKPRTPSSGTTPTAGAGITHSELVKPDGKPHDIASATGYITSMASTLLMFANKHAGVLPAGYGTAVHAFRNEVLKLEKARK